eukprot:CAMPEP_0197186272 /NCGR_PEP_ID=MMETSP1423-20130617/13586_1 /TAXON_ID=476441 /ORGANISM="Pseudo-nitzschia heimii, Strain UNC1101" /LENGTH=241 /DNA_ID=CAMNT_0042637539 /DNA_START=515 /DNA_END=1241 /DNA_ORIENTATION=+
MAKTNANNIPACDGSAATCSTMESSSSSLVPRFLPFPVKLLEFGKIVKSSSPPLCIDNNKKNGTDIRDLVVLGSWDIPLQGGALVLEDNQSLPKKSSSSRKSVSDYRGRLIFTIAKTSQLSRDRQSDASIESLYDSNSYQIITGIRDYRPWLAGGGYSSKSEKNKPCENIWDAIKANREATTRQVCHAFYLSTQSMVHAYVVWRFHNAWRQQLAMAVRTTAVTLAATEKIEGALTGEGNIA